MQSKHRQTGMTMIEIMVVVTIAAILAAVAMPSMIGMINGMRQTSTMSQLIGDLNRARSEAIKRNRRVLVCPRGTDIACGASWQNGWLVCYDENQDGACDANTAANPNPIVVHQALNTNLTLTLTAGAAPIQFNPSGTQGGALATAITWTLNGTWAGAISKTVNIATTGNISKTP
jgi:prepilin-type N-terminal cleavage/methylation domain-containing protein